MPQQIRPTQTKLLLFGLAVTGARRIVPAPVRSFLGMLLLGVTPNVPASLLSLGANSSPGRAGLIGALITFCFCFGGTVVATLVGGTFWGVDPSRIYFYQDRENLLNYAVLCPAYVGCGVAFILFVRQAWRDLRSNALISPPTPVRLSRLPAGVAVFVVLLVASALTVNYIRECMSPAV